MGRKELCGGSTGRGVLDRDNAQREHQLLRRDRSGHRGRAGTAPTLRVRDTLFQARRSPGKGTGPVTQGRQCWTRCRRGSRGDAGPSRRAPPRGGSARTRWGPAHVVGPGLPDLQRLVPLGDRSGRAPQCERRAAAALAALATGTLAHPAAAATAAAPINCVAKAKPEGATLYRLEAVDYGPEVDFERHMDYLFPARRLAGAPASPAATPRATTWRATGTGAATTGTAPGSGCARSKGRAALQPVLRRSRHHLAVKAPNRMISGVL